MEPKRAIAPTAMNTQQRHRARAFLRQRDGDRCYWCGKPMLFGKRKALHIREPDNWATIEHLTPVSQGGTDEASNLALACKLCNSGRAHKAA